jgi:hypothetical protein
MSLWILGKWKQSGGMNMRRDDILGRAEKHGVLTAGWIFGAAGLEKFWKEAYAAGRKAERKACADLTEQMGLDGYGTLAIAAAIRKRQ